MNRNNINNKEFSKFKFKEIKVNILLAFLCCVLAIFANGQSSNNHLNAIGGVLFIMTIVTYVLAHFWFYYKYKASFNTLGFPRYRIYFQRYVLFAIISYLSLSLESYDSFEISLFIITTYLIARLWFYLKRNAHLSNFGTPQFRKAFRRVAPIVIIVYLLWSLISLDSILEVFPFIILYPVLAVLFYLIAFSSIILPIINIVVLTVEFMEFENEWEK